MVKKKKDKEIDYTKLNEGIRIGVDILKIFLVLVIVSLVFISSKLLVQWGVLPFIRSFLRIKTIIIHFYYIILSMAFRTYC